MHLHLKTGNAYLVTGTRLNTTNAQNGQIMVEYERNGNKYCREQNEFQGKFSMISFKQGQVVAPNVLITSCGAEYTGVSHRNSDGDITIVTDMPEPTDGDDITIILQSENDSTYEGTFCVEGHDVKFKGK